MDVANLLLHCLPEFSPRQGNRGLLVGSGTGNQGGHKQDAEQAAYGESGRRKL